MAQIKGKLITLETLAQNRLRNQVNNTPYIPGLSTNVTPQEREAETYFGAGNPMPPEAPEGVRGRRQEIPFGYNTIITPKTEAGRTNVSFETLRRVADVGQGGLSLLRLVIDTVKDSIALQDFNIVARDGKESDKADKIKQLLLKPDGKKFWMSWIREWLEDHLVLDQNLVYIDRISGKDPLLKNMNGAQFKILVNAMGEIPEPPAPAFEYVERGMSSILYRADEVIFSQYNTRSNGIYGMSRVETVLTLINLALKKELTQLEWYSKGNIPQMLLSAPSEWSPEQLHQFSEYWNSILEGNLGNRAQAHFIPDGMKPFLLKEGNPLKNELDEWLLQLICFGFGISPQFAIKQMNKATAEVSVNDAKATGIAPIQRWVKTVMDDILATVYDVPELSFEWVEPSSVTPEKQAIILQTYVQSGIMTKNEARMELGLKALEEEQEGNETEIDATSSNGDDVDQGEEEPKATSSSKEPPSPNSAKVSKKKRLYAYPVSIEKNL